MKHLKDVPQARQTPINIWHNRDDDLEVLSLERFNDNPLFGPQEQVLTVSLDSLGDLISALQELDEYYHATTAPSSEQLQFDI